MCLFCLVNSDNYDIRIFYINNDKTKESLILYVQHNGYASQNRVYNNEDFEKMKILQLYYTMIVFLHIKLPILTNVDIFYIELIIPKGYLILAL